MTGRDAAPAARRDIAESVSELDRRHLEIIRDAIANYVLGGVELEDLIAGIEVPLVRVTDDATIANIEAALADLESINASFAPDRARVLTPGERTVVDSALGRILDVVGSLID